MPDLTAFLPGLERTAINLIEWFLLLSVIFFPLAYFFPNKSSQPLFRRDMRTDIAFFCFGPVYAIIQTSLQVLFITGFGYILTTDLLANEKNTYLSTLPLLAQILLILFATDFLQYWTHRISHKKILWKLHSIHHSSKNVDWLSAARWHPLNFLYHITLIQAVVWSLGFSSEAFPLVAIFSGLNGALVHANVNWTYGPLRYVFVSPVFHRWHHTKPSQGGEKNFAPFFSIYDVIFGTFYMPKGIPSDFGTPYDPIPDTVLGQLGYPFRKQQPKKSVITPVQQQ